MFSLARDYAARGMAAYADLQEQEFAAEKVGERLRVQGFQGSGVWVRARG
jgi:isocitrate lyase